MLFFFASGLSPRPLNVGYRSKLTKSSTPTLRVQEDRIMHSFLHSKLLNVLVDSVLNSLYDLVSVNIVTIDVIFLIARSRSLQVKIQLLRVNDLFDKDFKSYTLFLVVIYPKKCLIFVVRLPINIMRILSVQVAAIIPGFSFSLNRKEIYIDKM